MVEFGSYGARVRKGCYKKYIPAHGYDESIKILSNNPSHLLDAFNRLIKDQVLEKDSETYDFIENNCREFAKDLYQKIIKFLSENNIGHKEGIYD